MVLSLALRSSSLLLVLLLASYHGRVVDGKPYTFLDSGKESCFIVNFPMDIEFMIEYDAPDVKIGEEHPLHKEHHRHRHDPRLHPRGGGGGGAEEDAKLSDMVIKMIPYDSEDPHAPPAPPVLRREIESPRGSFDFTNESDFYELLVCAHAPMATRKSPRRIAFTIKEYEPRFDEMAVEVDAQSVHEHLTKMEVAVQRLSRTAEMVIATSERNKESEQEYHNQSIDMNLAAKWWPIVQVLVLLGTGFTQANYMVHFFKSRHII